MHDSTLLRQFTESGSQDAFQELVGRHTDLVYACARQRLHDAHAAEDVTQAVFLTLALKAKDLRSHTSLAGWLFTTTRYVATRYQRGERRRKEREMRTIEESQLVDAGATTEAAWEELQPHLAGALDSLSSADREAVLLRFFQNASHRDVAAALGTSEDGARMRVDRALNKLRRFFTNKGVALSAMALASAQTANAAPAAPAGLAATASATALAGASGTLATTSTLALAQGAIHMMLVAQIKTAALIAAACVVLAVSGVMVAEEVLTPPAVPVVAQAEPSIPPPATATNAAATMAWGAVTNELQAGLVPLGGVKGWERFLFLCPKHPEGTKLQSPHPSIAARNRCCVGCGALKPWSATFIEGEPMRMELHFRNLAKEKRSLFDAGHGAPWRFTLLPIGGGKPWQASYADRKDSRRASTIQIDVGELNEAAVELALDPEWRFLDPQGRESVTKRMPPGKYTVTASYALPELRDYWHGTVTTGPVEIEIVPATTGAVKHAFGQLPFETQKTLGNEGWLFIRSQARLDHVLEQFRAVEKPVRLPPVDFDKDMVFCHYALHDPDDKDEVVTCTGDAQRLTLSLLQGIVGNRDQTPRPKMHVVFCVVPKTKEFRQTTAQWVGESSPLLDEATARKDVTFDRTFVPEQGDVVAGLRGSIRAEKNMIQPGEDIKLEFTLEWDDPNAGRKQAAVVASQPVYVWDGKYSNGYRNHAFLVETPDGKTELLRRPVQHEWDKNIPHPVEIKDGQSYVLPEWVGKGQAWKSLKELGLDTTKPGVYKVTGIYLETAEETDGMAGRKPDGGKYLMWGGNLAANTVAIRVGDAR
jgi:RNA polymerase sigma factor (sigma-70 family)